jgi:2-polyprenyl-6-methoxyphenol hydroxylase-like FAD-dependent oxidoreductase
MYLTGQERGWIFLYQKLPQETRDRVSYTDSDMQAYFDDFKDFPVTDDLKVKDVWETRLTAGMANLEEGIASHWSWGRIVLAGDAAHKFTPNAGAGFNSGVQDIVMLCNGLRDLQNTFSAVLPSGDQSHLLLTEFFEKYEVERKSMISADASRSAFTTRTHAWANPLYYLAARYILPLKVVEYFMFEILAKWSMKKGLVLNYVDVDEPMKGAVEWDHPLNGLAGKAEADVKC